MTAAKPDSTQQVMTNEAMALRFAHDGSNFTNAGKSLSDEVKVFGPRYHLLCHAFELLLKSYILASGGDQSELRSIGHKLTDALTRAKELGFQPADENFETFVNWLDPYHRDHEFRYVKPSFKQPPKTEDLVRVLEGHSSR